MDLYLDLANAIRQRQGGTWVTATDRRKALRHKCLFHQDDKPSAYFYPDDGWYHCHACSQAFPVQQVADLLGVQIQQGPQSNGSGGPAVMHDSAQEEDSQLEFHHHITLGFPSAVYRYYWPDGRFSHYRLRFESGKGKDFRYQQPNGSFRLPQSAWPIYADIGFPQQANLVICESEKACDYINDHLEVYQQKLIWAITAGSSQNFISVRSVVLRRLIELKPARVLIWPDNDKAGREWPSYFFKPIEGLGISVRQLDPRLWNLEEHDGPDDYLILHDGSLAAVFEREFRQDGGHTLESLVKDVVVTPSDQFILPGTRQLLDLKAENTRLLWYRMTGEQPTHRLLATLTDALRNKASDSPTKVCYRRWHDDACTQFAWQPQVSGKAWHVNAQLAQVVDDPPHAAILIPSGEPRFNHAVDFQGGERTHLEHMLQLFQLDQDQITFIEGWLLCAFIGLETPILLLRGSAGAGKTTLARLLCGIVEPLAPSLQLPSRNNLMADQKELIGGLRQNIIAILDNVSSLSAESQDLLCQFVTGYSVVHRPLYQGRSENLSMKRAIIITTVNWDVSKGDLSSRTLPIRVPMREDRNYISSSKLEQELMPLMASIRGYLFKQAQRFYNNKHRITGTSHIRIAGLGDVLEALNYDFSHLSSRLSTDRSEIMTDNDVWYEAVCDFWDAHYQEGPAQLGDWFQFSLRDLLAHMYAFGVDNATQLTERRLGQWLKEHAPLFEDYGFSIEHVRSEKRRYWIFKCLRQK